jgi:hypothetical protein
MPGIEDFVRSYPRLRKPRERFEAIDRLIHHFHGEASGRPVRPAGRNVIGGTPAEIFELLDGLAEGPQTSDEIRRSRESYRKKRRASKSLFDDGPNEQARISGSGS